jgi:hypothetical protein
VTQGLELAKKNKGIEPGDDTDLVVEEILGVVRA